MRVLFVANAYNSLCQRMHVELLDRGHEVSIELATSELAMVEAVELYRPDLILAPMLTRPIPERIWRNHVCIILHPGIRGDRGASSLDWAIVEDQRVWGVTALQAAAEMDAGDVWSAHEFLMRPASKSSLYRNEIMEAAVRALLEAVERFASGRSEPEPLDHGRSDTRGRWHPLMKQADRRIDWSESTATIVRRIRAGDSRPGTLDAIDDTQYYLYGAHAEDALKGSPGELLAQRDGAICRATGDGAVWISHLRRQGGGIKLPAALALGEAAAGIPVAEAASVAVQKFAIPSSQSESELRIRDTSDAADHRTFREIWYEETDHVGYLHFDFYNGAMSTDQCRRLTDAVGTATQRPTRVLVLMGGTDFFSNGIHLNVIEAAPDPADESWANINAMNDLVQSIILTKSHLVVSAMQGNAAAGGVTLALAADVVWAREGVVLNPHYRRMGLYGSEYWTYLLPRRVGARCARELTTACLPVGTRRAKRIGLVDEYFGAPVTGFARWVRIRAEELAHAPDWHERLSAKVAVRMVEQAIKPLERYRQEELAQMRTNFYGPDRTYHIMRHNFVHKIQRGPTPSYLAKHRTVFAAPAGRKNPIDPAGVRLSASDRVNPRLSKPADVPMADNSNKPPPQRRSRFLSLFRG
ncbi:MAG: hydrogenase maturation protein [Rhizobiales bacterium]|nr:hydrogenase maturation protein [Hyphomicrobiales bacterium]